MSWADFLDHYAENGLGGVSPETGSGYLATLRKFQEKVRPQRLADFTTAKVQAFVKALRKDGRAEASIASRLRGLSVAANWAVENKLLAASPAFKIPKKAKGKKSMRGRPISAEEFDRMIAKTEKVCGVTAAASWDFYLRGLWFSGLRLSESLLLRWDPLPGALVLELGGRRPLMWIPSESEKGGKDRLLPLAPEFAVLLETVPQSERRGWVFRPLSKSGVPYARSRHAVGPVFSRIGKTAGVVVDERAKRTPKGKGKAAETIVRKFASAHDLRRGFGVRWSRKVMPAVLKELMHHEDIATTMMYYVGHNAKATADILWEAIGDRATVGATLESKPAATESSASAESVAAERVN